MTLYQTTLFGVRGGCVRIRKNSPIARTGVTLNAQRSTLNAQAEPAESSRGGAEGAEKDPCDGCLRVGVANCLACIEKGGGTAGAGSGSAPDGRRGEATGCGLLALLVLAAAIAAAALMIERRGVHVRVAWLTEYPDPVCERCGKVLDGTNDVCVEEVE